MSHGHVFTKVTSDVHPCRQGAAPGAASGLGRPAQAPLAAGRGARATPDRGGRGRRFRQVEPAGRLGENREPVLGQLLEQELSSDLMLVLDDVHELPWGSPSARLVEGLCRHAPANFHLVLASRTEPPFMIERLRASGQVLEVDPGLLALTAEETSQLLAAAFGDEPKGEAPERDDVTAALAA